MRAKDFIPAEKPRNFVAKNAKMGGAGQHRDKKKEQKQGYEKHKNKDVAEGLKPGWMLKKDPELAKKVKDKIDLAKKRQASYGDKDAGKSVKEAGYFGGGSSFSTGWSGSGRRRDDDWDEGNKEPPNNFAVYINGKKWKVFQGRGFHADDAREKAHFQQLKDWARKKSQDTGKKWEVYITGEAPTA